MPEPASLPVQAMPAVAPARSSEPHRVTASRRHPLLRIFAFLFAAILIGGLVGFLFGRAMLFRSAEVALSRYADELVKHSDSYGEEISSIFASARASALPQCSDDDIFRLRGFAFRSQVVKDVGRVRDGKLYCSGTLGRLPTPTIMPPVDFTTPYGKRIYANVPLIIAAGGRATILEVGGVDVVLGPTAFDGWGRPPMRYMVALVNPERKRVAQAFGSQIDVTPDWILAQKEGGWSGSQYRARCSAIYAFCVVTAIANTDIAQSEPDLLRGYTGLGAFAGLGIGMGIALLHRRSGSLSKQLRRAIRQGNLSVVYQPVVDLRSHAIIGAEALVRWTNDLGIPVPPDVFVSLAEQGGFISELTSFVLRRVLVELDALLRGPADFLVTINISADDLASLAFHSQLDHLVFESRIPAERIGLELTERTAANQGLALDAIQKLRSRGHRIYIDDFGTGYSSLAYLHELDVDAIKVDRSFTRTIGTAAVIASILPQILNMAAALDLAVTVEGVETEEQAAYLASTGHHTYAQGYYFSYPVAARELISRLVSGMPLDHAPLETVR